MIGIDGFVVKKCVVAPQTRSRRSMKKGLARKNWSQNHHLRNQAILKADAKTPKDKIKEETASKNWSQGHHRWHQAILKPKKVTLTSIDELVSSWYIVSMTSALRLFGLLKILHSWVFQSRGKGKTNFPFFAKFPNFCSFLGYKRDSCTKMPWI